MIASWSHPRTDLERRLLAIWERELGIHPIGVTDDFFELGVTSIVAATLFAAIESELGRQPSARRHLPRADHRIPGRTHRLRRRAGAGPR